MSEPQDDPGQDPKGPDSNEPSVPSAEELQAKLQESQKALKDLQKWKTRARELETEKEENQRKSLEANEQWKEAYEAEKRKNEELSGQFKGLSEGIDYNAKIQAVRQAAVKAGIRDEALDDLDLVGMETLEVEKTTKGKINVSGADDLVERLKASKPHWFQDATPPKVNGKTPEVQADPKDGSTRKELLDKYNEAYKKGDHKLAKELHEQLRTTQ